MRLGAALRRPVVLFDPDCGFCRRWVARWRARTGERVGYRPASVPWRWALGVPAEEARRRLQLVLPGGARRQGADAVWRVLAEAREPRVRWGARLFALPGMWGLSELVYGRVAGHRRLAARLDAWLFGRDARPPRYRGVRRLFLRALGGMFFVAFRSLSRQVLGLYGERGILPATELLEAAGERYPGRARLWRVPSLFWWTGASDRALVRGCRVGQGLAAALALGAVPAGPALAGLWALYLSYAAVGRDFLSFQWDVLLLETAALSATVAPWTYAGARREPGALEVGLMRALAFKLYLESGLAKWQSGDEAWRSLSACESYYATAPLPTPLGWWAHHLPPRLHRLSVAAVLALELGTPFLYFGPRRVREAAAAGVTGLQAAIALTGNYGFFNLLSTALHLWLLDDRALGRLARGPRAARRTGPARALVGGLAAVPWALLSALELGARFGWPRRVPGALERLELGARPFRSANGYGLFAVMTLRRPELEVEGSDDGVTWKAYRFRYKPDAPDKRPRWVPGHMPRLDWQLWFAALGSPPGWFIAFLGRLLEASPEVLGLLAHDPFGGRPPRRVRATLYEYTMTDAETRRRTGAWWKRERIGTYVPAVGLAPDGPEGAPPRGPRLTGRAPRA